ncbi:hypothetical protein SDC9_159579 [bioreactor metagenome]|uniref:Uncharacterized protein n=1 Tax=bioreactor metagenome TaxID=1076179 RepID=A0A645FIJ4_9ZZZZ
MAHRFSHTVEMLRTVIIADDRLNALRKSLNRHRQQLHDALHDRHGTYVKIAAIFQQACVENDHDCTFRRLHDEWRNSQGNNSLYQPELKSHVLLADPDKRMLGSQESEDIKRAQSLGYDRSDGRPFDTHTKSENKNRVQDDIGDSTDQY